MQLTIKKTILVWLIFGVILAGVFMIWLGDAIIGANGPIFLNYALLTWGWLRLVANLDLRLLPVIKDVGIRFSISWLLPILVILTLGLMHLPLPVVPVAVLAAIDLLIRFALDIWRRPLDVLLSMGKGIVLGSLMAAMTIGSHYPWMDALMPAGIGYVDDFRDAATIMAWDNYSAISHGVHGLLYEPYHSLSAMFVTPLMTDQISVFSAFVILSLIIVPALLVSGVSWLIMMSPSDAIRRNWPFVMFIFIFTFSIFQLVFTQRSLMIATLLLIGAIPALARIAFRPAEISKLAVLILAVLLPLIMFGRAFHGLYLVLIATPLLFLRSSSPKLLLLLGLIASTAIVIFFFGSTERAETVYFRGLIKVLTRSINWAQSSWLLILLPLVLYLKEKNRLPNFRFKAIIRDPFYLPILVICGAAVLLQIRSESSTDAKYQALPAFVLLFFAFILAPTGMISRKFPSGGLTDGLASKGVLTTVAFIVFLPLYMANTTQDEMDKEEAAIRAMIQDAITEFGPEVVATDSSDCAEGLERKGCEARVDSFGAHNLIEIAQNSVPARLARAALEHAQTLDGVTGIYVAPDHFYWTRQGARPNVESTYFMTVTGLPLLFGAPQSNRNPAYSIATAHRAGGTLASLSDIGGLEGLCLASASVDVDNVVVFIAGDNAGTVINCPLSRATSNDQQGRLNSYDPHRHSTVCLYRPNGRSRCSA